LELVKQKLGVIGAAVSRASARRSASPAAADAKRSRDARVAARDKRRPAPARRAPVSVDRQTVLDEVERVVKASQGVSASEVAKAANIPQTRAASALKELKLAKRIFQGGDRRFARYAGDAKTAEQASTTARKTAKGPVVRARANARGKKRPAAPSSQPATAAAA
jgi:hypothetical protein